MQALTLQHHDLSAGTCHRVPLHLQSRYANALQNAADESARKLRYVSVDGTDFRLFADFTRIYDGLVPFVFEVGGCITTMPQGAVAAQAAVAFELATAPVAWRLVMGPYLKFVALSRAYQCSHAPGGMPRSLPWVCSFTSPRNVLLTSAQRTQLEELVRGFGLIALDRCKAGVALRRRAGAEFRPNQDQFEELRDD